METIVHKVSFTEQTMLFCVYICLCNLVIVTSMFLTVTIFCSPTLNETQSLPKTMENC